MAVSVDIKKLLESGAHFGHTTSRWHPKMAPFIHSKRAGNHIVDLTKTVEALEAALPVITKAVAGGKRVLLVGTKRQAKELVKQAAAKKTEKKQVKKSADKKEVAEVSEEAIADSEK